MNGRARSRTWRHRWHGERCAAPGCARAAAHGHHVTLAQHVKREGGRLYDPANCLPLCTHHHLSHHGRSIVLPVSVLDDGHIGFAFDLLGPAAIDYLRRHYRDDQPWRLLEALAAAVRAAA